MTEERITVSREALRAELAELELRLMEKLATREHVVHLESRVASLELSRAQREEMPGQVQKLVLEVRELQRVSSSEEEVKKATRRYAVAAATSVSLIVATINLLIYMYG